MDWFFQPLSEQLISGLDVFIDEWFFVIAFGFLIFELIRYIFMKRISWKLIGDVVTNYVTLAMFIFVNIIVLASFYIAAYVWTSQFAVFDIPVNVVTVLICLILADFAYYWEHRFMHRVNAAWATHSVHHSSPFFNISVAYRFGPMDGVWPIFFHLPLVVLGFNPIIVFFVEMLVQVYQTLLHTEAIKKLPKPIENVMNTPSHHRVHHGSNGAYLDKNYGGIFIIWDKLFGSFAPEDEPVTYGLVKPLESINPLKVFFHGFWRLGKNAITQTGWRHKIMFLVRAPDWDSKNQN